MFKACHYFRKMENYLVPFISIYIFFNIDGENLQTVRENTEIFVKTSNDIGLKVNFEKTKYMATSPEQNIGGGYL